MGDSVSIGYYPFIKSALSSIALVQHSPWDQHDGGVEETEYGWRCLKYLLRAPTGTFIAPDILYFNWGLHNLILNVNNTIPGQSGGSFPNEAFQVIGRWRRALSGTSFLIDGGIRPEVASVLKI